MIDGHSIKIDRKVFRLKKELQQKGFQTSWHNPLLDFIGSNLPDDDPFIYDMYKDGVNLYISDLPVPEVFNFEYSNAFGIINIRGGSKAIRFVLMFLSYEAMREFCLEQDELGKPEIMERCIQKVGGYEFGYGEYLRCYLHKIDETFGFEYTTRNDANVYTIFSCNLVEEEDIFTIFHFMEESKMEKTLWK